MRKQKKPAEKGNRGRHLRDAAEEKLARTRGAASEMKEKTPEELVHELRVHQIELQMQNEELKKAQLALEVSRDKYLDLYDFAPVGFFTFTRGGRIAEVNLTGAALLGAERQELLNRGFGHFVAPENLEQWERHLVSVYKSEEKQSCDLALKREDGATFHARLDSIRLDLPTARLPDGQEQAGLSAEQAGVSGGTPVVRTAVSDITDRKRMDENIRLLATVVRNSNDAVTVQDFEGRIISWNRGAELMYGYSEDEAFQMTIWRLMPAGKRTEQEQLVRRLRTGETIHSFETQRLTKEGRLLDVWLTVTKLVDDAGTPVGIASTERDITERKRTEEALKKTIADMERSNKELEQFAYVASHDLQEPLRMVESFTQLLAKRYKDKLDADANEFIGYAVDGANRMQKMINDLLSYSRVGTRGKPFEAVGCTAILNQALTNLRMAIEETGAMITQDPLPTVMGDESQLVQLFQNLIDNAIKFRREEEPPRIHISAEDRGNDWFFSIKDNGIGIDPQYNERIFIIFQRLHRREEHPGTGIGLTICKKIVERHGGRVWVDSQPGNGSTFYFTIPKAGGLRL
jgi:PAS domain S-box-containing protein